MYQVLKRHVPPGARIADCVAEQLYLGPSEHVADMTAIDARREAVAATTGPLGTVAIDIVRPDGETAPWSFNRITADVGTIDSGSARSPGYPAHGCGRPMSPPSAVPAIVVSHIGPSHCGSDGARRLYCAGCCTWVDASADERLRALNAWAIERGA